MSAHWSASPWTVLDFESTGIDLENDRAVQVAVIQLDSTGVKFSLCRVINPGIEIPQGAIDVHGITNEQVQAEGLDPVEVIRHIALKVENAWEKGLPIVAMNASFDITLLDRELRRHAGRGLNTDGALVVDPLVVDRACDPYRPGKRKLDALADWYQVRQEGAHDALADCLTAARVVWRQARMEDGSVVGPNGRRRTYDYSPVRELSLPDLHQWQAQRYAEWAENFEQYQRTKANPPHPDAAIDRSWPWKPVPVQEGVPA